MGSFILHSQELLSCQLGINGGMAGNCLTTKIATVKKVKNRLEEDNRLNTFQIATNNKLNNMRTT